MAPLYRACDLFVLPSVGEGFPLVLQEAVASGLPVVCGEETVNADPAVKAFARGVPVYAGDDDRTAREFLSAVDELVNSGGQEDKSAERRDFAVSRYSWQNAVERYMEIASRLAPQAARAEPGLKAEETRQC